MDEVLSYLQNNFNQDVTNLLAIGGGERSKAFVFESGGKKYIFRKNRQEVGFKKDLFAYENFGKQVKIPKIWKFDKLVDGFGAISEFCEGKPLLDEEAPLSKTTVDSLLETLEKIKRVKIPEGGYGVADIEGLAKYASWKEWVLRPDTVVTKEDGSFYTWEEVKRMEFANKALVEQIFAEIKRLLPYVESKRYLLHGDFGTGNILIEKEKVSGIIDWNEFGYGDFLYDLAYLYFWITKTDFTQEYEKYCKKNGLKLPDNYQERMRCHKLFAGLTALGIYAAIGWKEGYKKVENRLKEII